MQIKISKLDKNAVIPRYMTVGAAAFDLVAVSKKVTDLYVEYGLGLAFEIPEGYCLKIAPRSSIFKQAFVLTNSLGIIDSDYRGEVKALFYKIDGKYPDYNIGDRICQGWIEEVIQTEFIEVPYNELSKTERATKGFGHTGNK